MPSEWERCAPWIGAAIKGAGLPLERVAEGVERGEFRLWAHPQGVIVTEFVVSPRSLGLNMFAGGGSAVAMWALLPTIEAFAKASGCDSIGVTGRKGWRRALKAFGYAPADTIIKEI